MQGSPYKPKVFISHSTIAEDELSCRFLDRLYQKLLSVKNSDGTQFFDVLLDRESLRVDDDWRKVIDEWIFNCDAAIVVLSEAATHSDYVKYEVTLLQKRRESYSNELILLPVCLPSVTDEHLRERMGPQQISERQIRRLTENNDDKILDELVSCLRLLPQRIPQHKIEEYLFSFFCFSFIEEELKILSDALAIHGVLVSARIDRAQMIVRLLLGTEPESTSLRFSRLRLVLDGLRTKNLDRNQRSQLLHFVFPFCWVNAEAAGKLPDIAARMPSTRAVAWAREWELSEEMYLLRGFCHPNAITVYVSNLDGGLSTNRSEDSFLDHIISCLHQKLLFSPPSGKTEDDKKNLCEIIQQREQEGQPVFLIIPLEAVDKDRVETILDDFPDLTVFLHTQALTQTEFNELGFPVAELLEPPLDLTSEKSARTEYGRLLQLIG